MSLRKKVAKVMTILALVSVGLIAMPFTLGPDYAERFRALIFAAPILTAIAGIGIVLGR